MFDFGLSFSHILVIVVLAVIAIGPKDLPMVLRRLGQFMNKMRGMARDFQGQIDGAMKDAGMEGIKDDLKSLKTGMSAAMSPVQTMMTSAASTAASPAAANASVTASMLPDLMTANSSERFFEPARVGETRLLGKHLDEAES